MSRKFRKCVVILARGGSKGIPRKNMIKLGQVYGKRLIWYPVAAAMSATRVKDVWVSTDDGKIKEHVREIAELEKYESFDVIDRPENIADDLSTDLVGMQHFLKTVDKQYDYIVHLRATFPTITSIMIDAAIKQFEDEYDGYDSLRSVARAKQSPYKMWLVNGEGSLSPVMLGHDLSSSPRQVIPPAYYQNAAVDIIKTWTIKEMNSMTGKRIMPFFMSDDGVDIDTLEDLEKAKEKSDE